MKSRPWEQITKLYASSALVYGIGIGIFRYLPYYQKTLNQFTQDILLYLYLFYLLVAPFYYFFFVTRYSENKPLLFLRGIKRLATKFQLRKDEKVASLFMIVKIFFLPLMIKFFTNNINFIRTTDSYQWFPLIFTLVFTIDTLVFSLGYTFEFKSLKNVVKSVEPTLLGWVVALISYPPFNGWVGNYVEWGAYDYVLFWTPQWTLALRVIIVFFLLIYLAATISLGPKASNLTNRGIVSRFPYSIVRHPAYISKNLIWWITLLPVMSLKFALGMAIWSTIYYFRAMTEERHLSQDPDYVEYKKKVKWKFIPGVY